MVKAGLLVSACALGLLAAPVMAAGTGTQSGTDNPSTTSQMNGAANGSGMTNTNVNPNAPSNRTMSGSNGTDFAGWNGTLQRNALRRQREQSLAARPVQWRGQCA